MFGTFIRHTTAASARLRHLKVEHRSDRIFVDLRSRQRVRVHRDAVPDRIGWRGDGQNQFFTALEEDQVIAQANLPHDDKGNVTQDVLIARVRGGVLPHLEE